MAIVNAARLAAVLLTAAALSALAGCGQGQQKQAGPPPPPAVTVANPEQRTVVDQDEYVGRFVAVDAVEVRARLSGYLSEIHFTDGQLVKKGDLLFTIDRRPFSIALEQMRANLAQARANLAFTEADLARGQELVHNKTITEQSYDQRIQAKRVAEASVAAQEAMVRSAELDFNEYSQLRAPIDGRIGDRRVSVGNLVSGSIASNTTLLATIVSVDPIRFEFTFDEASYLRYQRFAGPATQLAKGESGVSVSLKLIDAGLILERAHHEVFDNPGARFTPGMFGHIRVPGSPPHTALLIPDAAIGTEQSRKFVLVVDDGSVARQKYVKLGQLDGGLRVIKDGLAAGDKVIVKGLMRARSGQKVTVEDEPAPPPPRKGPDEAKAG